jgi:hypothetical protein
MVPRRKGLANNPPTLGSPINHRERRVTPQVPISVLMGETVDLHENPSAFYWATTPSRRGGR